MKTDPDDPSSSREPPPLPESPSRSVLARAAALGTLALSGFFLLLWLGAPDPLIPWVGARMKTNTALCLALAGTSLWLLSRQPRWAAWSQGAAVLVTMIASLTLAQYVLGIDLGIDQLIATDFPSPETAGFPNRMAPNAAVVLTLLGPALLLVSSPNRRRALAAQALAGMALIVAGMAATGYLYETTVLYRPTRFIRVSPYTILGATMLAVGVIFQRRDLGLPRLLSGNGPGGYLSRRLIVPTLLAPLVLGWLQLEGEEVGLYSNRTGTSLMVLLTSSSFLTLTLLLARSLDRLDARRRLAETELRASGELIAALAQAATVEQVVDVTVRVGLPALGATAGSVFLPSRDGKQLRLASSCGYSDNARSAFRIVAIDSDLPVTRCWRQRKPLFIAAPAELERLWPSLRPDCKHGAWVTLPVQAGERTIGILSLSYAGAQHFDERQRERLVQLARQCGQALDRALLYDEREETRALLESVLTAAPVGLAYLDRELRYVRVNAAFAELQRLPPEAHLGRRLDEVLPAAMGRFAMEQASEVLRTNLPRSGLPFSSELPMPPGAIRHFLLNYFPLPDQSGAARGVGIVVVDVTDEQRARQDAEAANRAKDEFMAMLGHELRNPLSPILTALQVMKLRGDDTHGKERAIIERQVNHMVRLVDDLLDVSRITRGKIELARRRVDLADIVAQAIEVASPLFEARRHQLSVKVPSGLAVRGDEHRLTQVVTNLLTNAAKYTAPGGHVEVTAQAVSGRAVLKVKDNGKGITPELLPRVFDLFVQGSRTPDRSSGGLGLGLSIARRLVEMHGGEVAVASEGPDRGSEFTIYLPLDVSKPAVDVAPATPVEGPAPAAPSRARRVLVVDDNRDAAETLAEALAMEGHEARVAFDGPSALRLAAELRPTVAFLDIGLPVMDGHELARRLRGMDLHPLTLVAITGYGQPSDRARSAEAGFDQHLVKPITLETALTLVEGTDQAQPPAE